MCFIFGNYKITLHFNFEKSHFLEKLRKKTYFLKANLNVSPQAGSTHTVTIEVEGTPAPELSFYKDGVEIKSSERIRIVKETEYIYKIIIKDAKLTDTGSYSVIAK